LAAWSTATICPSFWVGLRWQQSAGPEKKQQSAVQSGRRRRNNWRFAVDEKLTFIRAGLTVVYGDNGSRKSGYARILKQVCRARIGSRSEIILPNIYDANPGTPAATVDFAANNQNASSSWILEKPADPVLSAVRVFDSRTASVHVDDVNDVA
jgi:hypothetical protein